MDWRFTDRDPDPDKTGTYLVALDTGRVRVLYWSGLEWSEQMNFAPYEQAVVAWRPLPAYPEIPADVKKIRKRLGK